jgi:hypothetical protein
VGITTLAVVTLQQSIMLAITIVGTAATTTQQGITPIHQETRTQQGITPMSQETRTQQGITPMSQEIRIRQGITPMSQEIPTQQDITRERTRTLQQLSTF